MEIQKTINYFQFKQIKSNRPVDPRHVSELVKKIKEKNLLHLFPILVNSAMEVIDGQHRLAAAEQAQEYVFYFIDDNLSKSDISSVNVLSKKWTVNDYINFYSVEGKEGFAELVEFMIANPMIPATTALVMLSRNRNNILGELKQGHVEVTNLEKANQIAAILREYAQLISFAYTAYFIQAVIKCVNTEGYDHAIMQRKLEFQSRSLVKCISTKQYIELLDEIYNYGASKNRLKIAA